jgi:predicted PurR-regulated permease PerM
MENTKRSILFAFALGLGLVVAYTIRYSLLTIYVSCIFAIVLRPAVDWVSRLKIARWHPTRGVAISFLVVAMLVFLTVLLGFGLPQVITDIQQLFGLLPKELGKLHDRLLNTPYLPRPDDLSLQKYASSLASSITAVFGSIASGIASIGAVIVLIAYLILEGKVFERLLCRLWRRGPIEPLSQRRSACANGFSAGRADADPGKPSVCSCSACSNQVFIRSRFVGPRTLFQCWV